MAAVEQEIYMVDATLHLNALTPAQAAHVSGVLNRVVAGLAMEGFGVCLHMNPTLVPVEVDEEEYKDE